MTADGAAAAQRGPLRWRFGVAELDERNGTLRVDGAPVALDRRGHDLLAHLVRHAGQVVEKDDLLRVVWAGREVSENSVQKAIGRLRLALGDPDGQVLRVVHGYGYRLMAEVVPEEGAGTPPASGAPNGGRGEVAPPSTTPRASRRRIAALFASGALLVLVALGATRYAAREPEAAPEVPSIAVLPFLDLSSGHDQQHFSDGLADELLDHLAKLPQLHVVSRTSSFSYRGRQADVQTIGRELGARTVLEGSVRSGFGASRRIAELMSTWVPPANGRLPLASS